MKRHYAELILDCGVLGDRPIDVLGDVSGEIVHILCIKMNLCGTLVDITDDYKHDIEIKTDFLRDFEKKQLRGPRMPADWDYDQWVERF